MTSCHRSGFDTVGGGIVSILSAIAFFTILAYIFTVVLIIILVVALVCANMAYSDYRWRKYVRPRYLSRY